MITKKSSSLSRFLLCIFLIGPLPTGKILLYASPLKISDDEIEMRLKHAEFLINSFKSDSAMRMAFNLLAELRRTRSLNKNQGLRVRLVEAISFEQQELGDSAIGRLLPELIT